MLLQGLSYTQLESNIHEITLHDVQFSTVDLFFDRLDTILSSTRPDQIVRMLICVSQVPSMQYMIGRDRALTAKHPQRFKSRIAIVHSQSAQLSLLNMVGRALTHSSSLRLFRKDEVEDAMTWLRQ
jgi:hypothetical protein